MSKQEFKSGDIVMLHSGGPRMTVTRINDPDASHPAGLIAVAWFGNGDVLHRDVFAPWALRIEMGEVDVPKTAR